jgi:agmatinase
MPNLLPWSQGTVNLSVDTFARLPQVGTLEGVDVSVIEIPFDAGVTSESGGGLANARRAVSVRLRRYSPALHVKPSEVLSCVGRGDVSIVPGNIERSYEVIER